MSMMDQISLRDLSPTRLNVLCVLLLCTPTCFQSVQAQGLSVPAQAESPNWSLPKQNPESKSTSPRPADFKPTEVRPSGLTIAQVKPSGGTIAQVKPTTPPPQELFATEDPFASPPQIPIQKPLPNPSRRLASHNTREESSPLPANTGEDRRSAQQFPGLRPTSLIDPLPLAAPPQGDVYSLPAPQQTSSERTPPMRDRQFLPIGNSEPAMSRGEITREVPAPLAFPSDDAPRMSPPESSIFSTEIEVAKPVQQDSNPFPDQLLEIPGVEDPLPVSTPQHSRPAPFASEIESSRNTDDLNSSQLNYDPPANEPRLLQPGQSRLPAQPSPTFQPSHFSEPNTGIPSQAASSVREDIHEVQPGENYWTISRQHFGTARYFAALAEYNKHRIPRPDRMKPGMYVLIPDAQLLEQRYPKIAGIIDSQPSPESLLQPGYFIGENNQPYYRIGKGDTLTDIAENHLGRTARWTQIVGMNQGLLKDGNTLKIGMVLRLPHDASQVSLAPSGGDVR